MPPPRSATPSSSPSTCCRSAAAREIGAATLETKAQPPQQVAGKYVVVWPRIGGKWRLATEIWNMNK